MATNKLALEAFRVVGSTDRGSHATVRISRGGRDHAEAQAEGNGPMDALFRATDAALGIRGEVTGLRIYAFDSHGMVGKARITVNFEAESTGGEARTRMRSRQRLTPTCTQLPPTSPLRFQDPAQSKPLRDLAKEYPASGWSDAGRDAKDGRFYECDTICNAYPPIDMTMQATTYARIMARKDSHGGG
jgi:hypothetical protein